MKASLGDYIEQVRGVSYSGDEVSPFSKENYLPVLRANNISGGELIFENVVFVPKKRVLNKQLINKGDIILAASSGSKEIVGKAALARTDWEGSFGAFCKLIRVSEKINPCYLNYFFKSNYYRRTISSVVNGANINNLRNEDLNNIKLNVPPLEIQSEIARELDDVYNAIQKRKAANALTDQFLQSTFLSMFGDPVKNEKEWTAVQFGDIGESRLGKMLDGKKQTGKNKFKYLGNSNVKWGEFDFKTLLDMDFDESERNTFSLEYGDVLICEGGEVGRTAIWKDEVSNCYFQKALHRVRLNKQKALPEYILFLMWFYAKGGGFKDSVRSATIPHLTGVQLKAMQIPLPPIILQQKFASIVADTEQLRQKQKQSEIELENLFQALLQKNFG